MTGSRNTLDVTAQFRTGGEVTTAELLSRIIDWDAVAWKEIFHRYGKLVSATVRSFRLSEADALNAAQMTWLRLAENAHRIQHPEQLGGWLRTTARRECLHILRQGKPIPGLIDVTPDTVADPSMGPGQRVIEADIAQTLHKLVAELSPRHRTLMRTLFNAEIAESAGIPLGGIGPTRARALRQLQGILHDQEQESRTASTKDAKPETVEGGRTGSYLLDDLLDKADQALREKLDPKIAKIEIDGSRGTGDAQLDDLLQKADAALRAAPVITKQTTMLSVLDSLLGGREALVSAAVAGDPHAIEDVLRWIRPLVVQYCRARVGGYERTSTSADDVAQEVCLAVLSALPNYRDQGRPFLAFVYGIASHKVADAHRSAARNRTDPALDNPDTTDQADGPEAQVMHGEIADRTSRLMESLSDKQREIVYLRVVMGLSVEETAEAVGSTPGAVRVAQHRALARLRDMLTPKPASGRKAPVQRKATPTTGASELNSLSAWTKR